jgi:CTP:molybdopterin cytidylyltransferase MocA
MTTAAIVLAAGKGTRFASDLAKVLHPVAGRTMLRWVLEALRPLALDRVVVVVGHQAEAVTAEAEAAGLPGLTTVTQHEQNGTGHAVRVAVDAGVLDGIDTVLVLPGDVPLMTPDALRALQEAHEGRAVTLLTADLDDATGYGRVIRGADGDVARIVEHRDATPEERAVTEVNSSIYAFAAPLLVEAPRASRRTTTRARSTSPTSSRRSRSARAVPARSSSTPPTSPGRTTARSSPTRARSSAGASRRGTLARASPSSTRRRPTSAPTSRSPRTRSSCPAPTSRARPGSAPARPSAPTPASSTATSRTARR